MSILVIVTAGLFVARCNMGLDDPGFDPTESTWRCSTIDG